MLAITKDKGWGCKGVYPPQTLKPLILPPQKYLKYISLPPQNLRPHIFPTTIKKKLRSSYQWLLFNWFHIKKGHVDNMWAMTSVYQIPFNRHKPTKITSQVLLSACIHFLINLMAKVVEKYVFIFTKTIQKGYYIWNMSNQGSKGIRQ